MIPVGMTDLGDGHWLNPAAATSFGRVKAADCPIAITSAGRTPAEQQQLRETYLADPAHHAYAAPVTGANASEHITGNALDCAEPMRTWMHQHGREWGWSFTGGAAEPWHFAYRASLDQHLTPMPYTLTTPTPSEDDMLNVVRNYDGSIGLIGADGTLTPIGSLDTWNALERAGVAKLPNQQTDGTVWNLLTAFTAQRRQVTDVQALAAAIVPAVLAALPTTLTQAQVEAAAEQAIRHVLGSLG